MTRSRKANNSELACRAIAYLLEHDLVLKWDYPEADPPPEEIRLLIAPFFSDGEVELDMAWFLSDYLIAMLEKDSLRIPDSQSSQDPHRPRVVCGEVTSA